jgi:hypothetical protein
MCKPLHIPSHRSAFLRDLHGPKGTRGFYLKSDQEDIRVLVSAVYGWRAGRLAAGAKARVADHFGHPSARLRDLRRQCVVSRGR